MLTFSKIQSPASLTDVRSVEKSGNRMAMVPERHRTRAFENLESFHMYSHYGCVAVGPGFFSGEENWCLLRIRSRCGLRFTNRAFMPSVFNYNTLHFMPSICT